MNNSSAGGSSDSERSMSSEPTEPLYVGDVIEFLHPIFQGVRCKQEIMSIKTSNDDYPLYLSTSLLVPKSTPIKVVERKEENGEVPRGWMPIEDWLLYDQGDPNLSRSDCLGMEPAADLEAIQRKYEADQRDLCAQYYGPDGEDKDGDTADSDEGLTVKERLRKLRDASPHAEPEARKTRPTRRRIAATAAPVESSQEAESPQEKTCRIRGCKRKGSLVLCAECSDKYAHPECYDQKVLDDGRDRIVAHVDGEGDQELVFCSKSCYNRMATKIKKEKERKEKEAHQTRFLWDQGGTEGVNAETVLLEWLTTHGNYLRWRGDSKKGKRKTAIAQEIADLINEKKEIRVKRSAEDVAKKIRRTEKQFHDVFDWSYNGSGQGLRENDPPTWKLKVQQRCRYFFELWPILGERASTKALTTSDDPYTFSFRQESDHESTRLETRHQSAPEDDYSSSCSDGTPTKTHEADSWDYEDEGKENNDGNSPQHSPVASSTKRNTHKEKTKVRHAGGTGGRPLRLRSATRSSGGTTKRHPTPIDFTKSDQYLYNLHAVEVHNNRVFQQQQLAMEWRTQRAEQRRIEADTRKAETLNMIAVLRARQELEQERDGYSKRELDQYLPIPKNESESSDGSNSSSDGSAVSWMSVTAADDESDTTTTNPTNNPRKRDRND